MRAHAGPRALRVAVRSRKECARAIAVRLPTPRFRNITYVFAPSMDYRVTYEHSLATAPDDFIVNVPSQLVSDVPSNIPKALLPEAIEKLILERSPRIGRIRNLRLI
ncbi:hypothetical protein PTKU15_34080 [Paraburkholderia terrae]|nr:hypothetical protein PTKU15_34080 [Paraburkholderia terrae]